MRRSHATGRVVGRLSPLLFLLIPISLLHLPNVSPPHQPPNSMAITTRANKEKPISRATVATATTPAKRHPTQCAKRLAKSPHTSSVNIHLANINRPMLRINSILQALQPTKCAAPNPDKDSLMMAPVLPTTVDIPDGAPVAPNTAPCPRTTPQKQSPNPLHPAEASESARQPPQGLLQWALLKEWPSP